MTIITSQEQFNKRLHRAKLDVIYGRTITWTFKEIMYSIKSKNINKNKELCIK